MRARIFSGDRWVGGVSVPGVGGEEGVEDEEMRRTSEVRSNISRRAIVDRDMVTLKGRVYEHREPMCRTRSKERVGVRISEVENWTLTHGQQF